MEFLNKDTKPCPHCGTMIFKISGCSQIFCVDCHTAWDWNTSKIITGVIHNPHYYEFLNRLRLYLQLTAMSSAKTVMQIKLPEGLNRETHPGAASYWDDFLKEQPGYQAINTDATDTPTLLIQIQDYILTHVLKTEHLQRIVAHTCNKFNRLVVKLEMSVDNPDFWEETEPQS